MISTKKFFLFASFVLLILISVRVNADSLYAGLELGKAEFSGGDFKGGSVSNLFGGYRFGSLYLQLDFFAFEDFSHSNFRDSYLQLDAYAVQAGVQFDLGKVNLQGGVGLFSWEEDAVLFSRGFGSDSGTSELIDVGLLGSTSEHTTLQLGFKHIGDVSGADLQIISLGLRYNF